MEPTYLIPPILGGIIGYITNDIAIRMLFRPHKTKYVMGVHLPFTPGIIPKEKGRMAEAIGSVISDNLMNEEVLLRYLLSDEMTRKVRGAAEEFAERQKANHETVRAFLSHYLTADEIDALAKRVNQSITRQTCSKLTDKALGEHVARATIDHVARKLSIDGAQELASGIKGALGGLAAEVFGGSMVSNFLGQLRAPAERMLAKHINQMLADNGEQMVANLIGGEVDGFLSKPVCQLLEGHDEQITQAIGTIVTAYRKTVNDHLPQILKSIDISKIVRERINEMDINETEKLIFQVMNKELRAVVWLGALLGMLMGCANLVIR